MTGKVTMNILAYKQTREQILPTITYFTLKDMTSYDTKLSTKRA